MPRAPRLNLESKFAELRSWKTAPEEIALAGVRRLLSDPTHLVVARAATLATDRLLDAVIPDLLTAFNRLFGSDPGMSGAEADPRCLAKVAVANALKVLGHTDPAPFLRGIAHVQMEPDIPKPVDTAPALRGMCALGLVGSSMDSFDVLIRLTDLLTDPAPIVRQEAARAIGGLALREGVLPLRLKVALGDPEPEVVGECLSALLRLEPKGHIGFVGATLKGRLWIEGAIALAGCDDDEAVGLLIACFGAKRDPAARGSLISLLGGSPALAAAEFLMSLLVDGAPAEAELALDALAGSRYRSRLEARIREIAAGREGLLARWAYDADAGSE